MANQTKSKSKHLMNCMKTLTLVTMKDYEFMPHLKESKFLSTGCLDLFVIQLSQGSKHVNNDDDDDDDSIQYFDSAKKPNFCKI